MACACRPIPVRHVDHGRRPCRRPSATWKITPAAAECNDCTMTDDKVHIEQLNKEKKSKAEWAKTHAADTMVYKPDSLKVVHRPLRGRARAPSLRDGREHMSGSCCAGCPPRAAQGQGVRPMRPAADAGFNAPAIAERGASRAPSSPQISPAVLAMAQVRALAHLRRSATCAPSSSRRSRTWSLKLRLYCHPARARHHPANRRPKRRCRVTRVLVAGHWRLGDSREQQVGRRRERGVGTDEREPRP